MRVTVEEVDRIAMLSRLSFEDSEKIQYRKHLEAILETARKLAELDTEGVAPTAHIQGIENVLREDRPEPSMENGLLTSNAPERDCGCFIVPKVVE